MSITERMMMLGVAAFASVADGEVSGFERGDRVVFVGDSITHGGGYLPNVYLFYATRFPDRPFDVYNCGISGDTTPGTNERFDSDIAPQQPNVATIMLGMNDAWSWLFNDGEATDEMLEAREQAYGIYKEEMERLAESLRAIGCRLIFITPSIYDETAQLEAVANVGRNGLLGRFAGVMRELAPKYEAGIVDFHAQMSDLNSRLQKVDVSATVVGEDRVHPGEEGHLVMTYLFLKAQGMPALVSSIRLNSAANSKPELENCVIDSDVKKSPLGISFTCVEESLPFPVTGEQAKALEWVPFVEELNQQVLIVEGLEEGEYELLIDDQRVGVHASSELQSGINLSGNRETPQYRQALEVKAVNDERLEVVTRLRALAHVRHTMLRHVSPPVSEEDAVVLRAALDAHVEESKAEPWYDYLKDQVETFMDALPQEEELRRQEAAAMKKIWTVNQPKARRWEIRKLEERAPVDEGE